MATGKGHSLFGPRASSSFSRIINIKTVGGSKKAITRMQREFHDSTTRARKIHVVKSLEEAGSIAKVIATNPRTSPAIAKKKDVIAENYQNAAHHLENQIPPRDRNTIE